MDVAPVRLWRARRRHAHIDALLRADGDVWEVSYSRDDRPLLSQVFPTEDAAREDADIRLRDLQRAGWVDHW